jgi:hypothetical protein
MVALRIASDNQANNRKTEIIKLIVQKSENLESKDKNGQTALFYGQHFVELLLRFLLI